jgi:hypothetical protein
LGFVSWGLGWGPGWPETSVRIGAAARLLHAFPNLEEAPRRPIFGYGFFRRLGRVRSEPAVHLRDGRRGRISWAMVKQPDRLDPKERAREKQLSRQEDARALASGEKSREELRRENGHFVFPNVRISARGSKPLE